MKIALPRVKRRSTLIHGLSLSYSDENKWNKEKCTFYTYSTAAPNPKSGPIKRRDFTSSRCIPEPTNLTHNAIHESSLHACNLTLESIDLLPAVQRPTVIQLQAASNIRAGLGNSIIELHQLPPSIKLAPQLLDLGSYRVARDIALNNGLFGGSGLLRRGDCRHGVVVAAGEGNPRCVQVQ